MMYIPLAGEIAHIIRDGADHRDRAPVRRCVHGCCGYRVIDEYQGHAHSEPPESCDDCQTRAMTDG